MNIEQIIVTQPTYVWLVGGLVFLGLGLTVGEPIFAALGLAALITAIAALTVKTWMSLFIIWSILSIALSVVLRGLVPRRSKDLNPERDATVSETIPRGGVGLVSHEGALWKARCQISDVAIAPGQSVRVIGRQGLTLIVLPLEFSDEPVDSI